MSERDCAEMLAYLIAAARTQLEEAPEYAPMRLLNAATRLSQVVALEASPALRVLIEQIEGFPPVATPTADPVAYTEAMDRLCVSVAECLLAIDDDD